MLTWKDPKGTLKSLIAAFVLLLVSYLTGDGVFIWIVLDIIVGWPVIKGVKIGKIKVEELILKIDEKLDKTVNKVPMIKRIELKD